MSGTGKETSQEKFLNVCIQVFVLPISITLFLILYFCPPALED